MRKWCLILPILLTSCGFQSNGFFPGPLFARDFPPPGPPNYQQGMIDGCQTALTAVGAPGISAGVIEFDALDNVLIPTALVALTLQV